MAKLTLLQIVQDVASDIDTDEINSIDDTPEATQIANIVRSTYASMMASRSWPHTAKLVSLISSGDNTKPNIMTFDTQIKELISVYYNKVRLGETKLNYQPVKYIEPDDMLRKMYGLNTTAANVQTVSDSGGQVYVITNDRAPTYFTSFDDSTLVFDSYDSAVDNTLQAAKTQVRAYVTPAFSLTDSFVPDLPEEAFAFLVEEVKSRSSLKIAQKVDQKSEQGSRTQNQWLSRKNWRVNGGIKYENYGRNSGGRSKYKPDPTFEQGKN